MRQQYGRVRNAIFHALVASANAYLGALNKLMIEAPAATSQEPMTAQ
jgi:hypothetical protein